MLEVRIDKPSRAACIYKSADTTLSRWYPSRIYELFFLSGSLKMSVIWVFLIAVSLRQRHLESACSSPGKSALQ